MLRYDALSVNGAPLPVSRGLCPARGLWEDPARDGKAKKGTRTNRLERSSSVRYASCLNVR